MAKRNKTFSIDFSQFEEYGEKLDRLGVDLKTAIGATMEKAGEKVQEDVAQAVESANLPAKGIYSKGYTRKSIIENTRVEWSGMTGEMKLGFDKSKPGAGGFLITGTPKMQPDKKLAQIFQSKKYKSDIVKQIKEELQRLIDNAKGRK